MSERYPRQIPLSGFGDDGQQKLRHASVLVVGAGGLGCSTLSYQAAAGVGSITVVDGDVISAFNLNRQTFYGASDIGKYKTPREAQVLRRQNSEITVRFFPTALSERNAPRLLHNQSAALPC